MIQSLVRVGYGTTVLIAHSQRLKRNAIKASFNENDNIEKPLHKVSIVMPSYNEESLIEYALISLREQNIVKKYPENFEFILVDSNSIDNTVNIASKYVDKIVYAGKGKLTARNYVLSHLDGDLIAAVDADCYYLPNWLNLMLKPFSNYMGENIVGTIGFSMDEHPQYSKFINLFYPLAVYLEWTILHPTRMNGGNCVYYKDIQYLEPFNEDIDQLNSQEMIKEEEINFGRLSKYGKVLYLHNAARLHLGNMKIGCRSGRFSPKDEIDKLYCEQIRNKERF